MSSYCPNCGEPVKDGAKFCGNCGYALAKDGRFAEKATAPNKKAGNSGEKDGDAAEKAIDSSEVIASASEETEAQEAAEVSQAVADKPEAAEPAAAEPVAEPQKAPRPKRRTLREYSNRTVKVGFAMVPLYAAIIVALITTIGVAYAAVMLYQNVIEPAIVQMQHANDGQAESSASDDASDATQEASSQEKPMTYTAEGNPQSVLQLAEILAMDPTQIPAYFENQGISFDPGNTSGIGRNGGYGSCWRGAGGHDTISDALAGIGAEVDFTFQHVIALGKEAQPDDIYGGYVSDMDSAALQGGSRPQSVYMTADLTSPLDDVAIANLIDACGFKSSSSHWDFNYSGSDYYSNERASSWTGLVEEPGGTSLWFVRQTSVEKSNRTSCVLQIGCISLDLATSVLRQANDTYNNSTSMKEQGTYSLLSSAELANKSNEEKSLLYAQYLVQRGIDQQSFRGVDVVTGESASM